ncbi:MAG: flippase [Thainema sp.]
MSPFATTRRMRSAFLQYLPPIIRRKLSDPSNQKIAGNTAWLFVDKILRAIGELTIGIWVARYLGPEQFGLLNYAIAFVSMFSAFSTLGLNKIVVRDIVQTPTDKDEILGTAFGLRLLSGFCIAAIAIALILVLRPGETAIHWLVGFAAIALALQASEVVSFWFQSQVQAKQDIFARSSAYLITSAAKVGLIFARASVYAFGVIALLETFIRSVGLGIVYIFTGQPLLSWKFNLKRAKTLLASSWPLILSGIAVTVYMRIDQIMLGQMIGDDAVGIYSAAVKLSESWYFIPVAIASSIFPTVLQAKLDSQDTYCKKIHSLFKFVIGINYLIILPMMLFSTSFISLTFGQAYQEAGLVLSIHVWSGLFVSLGVIRELWMAAENLLVFSFITTMFGAVINILTNYLLIPSYAEIGAAIATLVSYIIAAYLACFFSRNTRPIAYIMSSALLLR